MKIVYISGCGRSGSTLLDTILSEHNDIVGVGELTNLFYAGWKNNEYCSCQKQIKECEFWTKVKEIWEDKSDLSSFEEYIVLQKKVERIRFFFKLIFNKKLLQSNEVQKYIYNTKILYEAIQIVSSKKYIIDSSKTPIRAFLLSQSDDIDLYIIHLIRDIRGFGYSMKKAFKNVDLKSGVQKQIDSKSNLYILRDWWLLNILTEKIGKKSKYLRIIYEEFLNDSNKAMKLIGDFIDLDMEEVSKKLNDGFSPIQSHKAAGNRLRMQKKIILKKDMEWETKLSSFDKNILKFCSYPLLKKYGYL